jgi:hypothetical protein
MSTETTGPKQLESPELKSSDVIVSTASELAEMKMQFVGGAGAKLAKAIYDDLKKHAGVEGMSLLQLQGKVTDGQYINQPYTDQPIFDILKSMCTSDGYKIVTEAKLLECQWLIGSLVRQSFLKA